MRCLAGILIVLASYLLGSANLSYLLAKRRLGVDLRRVGSGNLGASNLAVQAGKGQAAVAFLADCAEEAASILVMRAAGFSLAWQAAAGLAAMAGHNWPFYLRFQGGRGMAMALTGTLILLPYEGAMLVAFLALGVFTHHTAEMNLVGVMLVPVVAWRLGRAASLVSFALALLLLAVMRRLQGSPSLGKKTIREDPLRVIWSRLVYDREVDRCGGMPRSPDGDAAGGV